MRFRLNFAKIDYNQFITPFTQRRRPAIIRELNKLRHGAPPELISLAEGLPNKHSFPFKSVHVELVDGTNFTLKGSFLEEAVQYTASLGYPPMAAKLKDLTKKFQNPPCWNESDIIVTTGSQDGISKVIDMCVEEGDPVLVSNPMYSGAKIIFAPYDPKFIGIDQDENGVIPEVLDRTLNEYKKRTERGLGKMPKIFYVNPTGANPTGYTIPLNRRREIYEICCHYNLLILEDDPYFFIYFGDDPAPPSFLSLDTEGRVLRFDSFSKILSPGLRLGWITGPKQLIRQLELIAQAHHLHSSTFSQAVAVQLLEAWGHDNFMNHLRTICDFYKGRRDAIISAFDKHMKGLAQWTVPTAGMFIWFKVPSMVDVKDMLMKRAVQKLVLMAPGHDFMVNHEADCNYIRVSFSNASDEQFDKAMETLASMIQEEKDRQQELISNRTV